MQNPELIKKAAGLFSQASPADDRTRLLLALKPFLSKKRSPYIDSAISILKLASLGEIGKSLNLF